MVFTTAVIWLAQSGAFEATDSHWRCCPKFFFRWQVSLVQSWAPQLDEPLSQLCSLAELEANMVRYLQKHKRLVITMDDGWRYSSSKKAMIGSSKEMRPARIFFLMPFL